MTKQHEYYNEKIVFIIKFTSDSDIYKYHVIFTV